MAQQHARTEARRRKLPHVRMTTYGDTGLLKKLQIFDQDGKELEIPVSAAKIGLSAQGRPTVDLTIFATLEIVHEAE